MCRVPLPQSSHWPWILRNQWARDEHLYQMGNAKPQYTTKSHRQIFEKEYGVAVLGSLSLPTCTCEQGNFHVCLRAGNLSDLLGLDHFPWMICMGAKEPHLTPKTNQEMVFFDDFPLRRSISLDRPAPRLAHSTRTGSCRVLATAFQGTSLASRHTSSTFFRVGPRTLLRVCVL